VRASLVVLREKSQAHDCDDRDQGIARSMLTPPARSLDKNNIDAAGAQHLAEALVLNTTLQKLE
jgi:hypothetical protein